MKFFLSTVAALILMLSAVAEEAAPGRELDKSESDVALRSIVESFKAAPRIRAKIISEVEDLAGKRTEEGELLLERPSRVLRRYQKPRLKLWMLDGQQLIEFTAGKFWASVKDLSDAPKLLKQIRAALTGDFAALDASYSLKVYAIPAAGEIKEWCLVFEKKPGINGHFYKRIESRISPGEKFFHEISYEPDEGDAITERFLEIQAVEKFDPAEFELPAGTERKVTKVAE